jgi:hypothetical protein
MDYDYLPYNTTYSNKVAVHDDHKALIKTPDDYITTDKLLRSKFMVKTEEEVIASLEKLLAQGKKDRERVKFKKS